LGGPLTGALPPVGADHRGRLGLDEFVTPKDRSRVCGPADRSGTRRGRQAELRGDADPRTERSDLPAEGRKRAARLGQRATSSILRLLPCSRRTPRRCSTRAVPLRHRWVPAMLQRFSPWVDRRRSVDRRPFRVRGSLTGSGSRRRAHGPTGPRAHWIVRDTRSTASRPTNPRTHGLPTVDDDRQRPTTVQRAEVMSAEVASDLDIDVQRLTTTDND
jgi:hypothetical protein